MNPNIYIFVRPAQIYTVKIKTQSKNRNAKYFGIIKVNKTSKVNNFKMSTNKRLAKRSIVGTRVCAPGPDKLYYSGIIQKVKTHSLGIRDNNCIPLAPDTKYIVRFDFDQGNMVGSNEYLGSELIGPGFQSVMNVNLAPGQRIFITYNGRESGAEVLNHDFIKDEVSVRIPGNGFEVNEKLYHEIYHRVSFYNCRLAKTLFLSKTPYIFIQISVLFCPQHSLKKSLFTIPF